MFGTRLLAFLVVAACVWGAGCTAGPEADDAKKVDPGTEEASTAEAPVQSEVPSADEENGGELAAVTSENAVELQRASAPDGEITRTVDLGDGVTVEMVWIPPGSFMMGSPDSEEGRLAHEGPQHRVELTQGFWMGKYEVTQSQWESVMGSNPSAFKGADRPVEQVSWEDCQAFLERLNIRVSGGGFRLPTEAEWEYACRAGTMTPFHFGQTISTDHANYNGDFTYPPQVGSVFSALPSVYRRETTPVGRFPANAWGLHDMHGNVCEWCQDWYGDYPGGAVCDPQGPASGGGAHRRVNRGGGWYFNPGYCRSAMRMFLPLGMGYTYLGFRVVLVAPRAS